ncbi:hypothetical protein EDD15DRAFT_2199146 [Pisolithus albus]|nr:hypothetical protein EDD15DRAFT_2199146 [Pisolithus albus]
MSRVCYQNPQARSDDLMLAFAYDTLHVSQRNQTFKCLPTPSGSPTRPRSSTTIQGLDGLWLPAGRSMYDTTRQAILDGVPVDVLCHLVLLNLVRKCAELAEAVYDEQQRMATAACRHWRPESFWDMVAEYVSSIWVGYQRSGHVN